MSPQASRAVGERQKGPAAPRGRRPEEAKFRWADKLMTRLLSAITSRPEIQRLLFVDLGLNRRSDPAELRARRQGIFDITCELGDIALKEGGIDLIARMKEDGLLATERSGRHIATPAWFTREAAEKHPVDRKIKDSRGIIHSVQAARKSGVKDSWRCWEDVRAADKGLATPAATITLRTALSRRKWLGSRAGQQTTLTNLERLQTRFKWYFEMVKIVDTGEALRRAKPIMTVKRTGDRSIDTTARLADDESRRSASDSRLPSRDNRTAASDTKDEDSLSEIESDATSGSDVATDDEVSDLSSIPDSEDRNSRLAPVGPRAKAARTSSSVPKERSAPAAPGTSSSVSKSAPIIRFGVIDHVPEHLDSSRSKTAVSHSVSTSTGPRSSRKSSSVSSHGPEKRTSGGLMSADDPRKPRRPRSASNVSITPTEQERSAPLDEDRSVGAAVAEPAGRLSPRAQKRSNDVQYMNTVEVIDLTLGENEEQLPVHCHFLESVDNSNFYLCAAIDASPKLKAGIRGEMPSYPRWQAERDLYIKIFTKEKPQRWLQVARESGWVIHKDGQWAAADAWDHKVFNPVSQRINSMRAQYQRSRRSVPPAPLVDGLKPYDSVLEDLFGVTVKAEPGLSPEAEQSVSLPVVPTQPAATSRTDNELAGSGVRAEQTPSSSRGGVQQSSSSMRSLDADPRVRRIPLPSMDNEPEEVLLPVALRPASARQAQPANGGNSNKDSAMATGGPAYSDLTPHQMLHLAKQDNIPDHHRQPDIRRFMEDFPSQREKLDVESREGMMMDALEALVPSKSDGFHKLPHFVVFGETTVVRDDVGNRLHSIATQAGGIYCINETDVVGANRRPVPCYSVFDRTTWAKVNHMPPQLGIRRVPLLEYLHILERGTLG